MALSELQKTRTSKTEMYDQVAYLANNLAQSVAKWQAASDYINKVSSQDLTDLGITDANVVSRLTELRGVFNDLISYYNGNAVSAPSTSPQTVIDDLRDMIII